MSFHSRVLNFIFVFVLSLGILLPDTSYGVGKGMATVAKLGGAVLIGVGVVSLVSVHGICSANPAAQITSIVGPLSCPTAYAGSLAEIAGGAAAMMVNASTESQLDSGATPDLGAAGAPTGYAPGSPTIPDLCTSTPTLCNTDPDTGRPRITLPTLVNLQNKVKESYAGKDIGPDGTSLDDALKKLNENYAKANDAVAAFNAASDKGELDSGLGKGGDTQVAAVGDETGGPDKNANRAMASVAGADTMSLPGGMSLEDLMNKAKVERGEFGATKANGLNLENARTGRILTIFERLTRAVRGTRDRDILLAKVEWSRKAAFKNSGTASPMVKSHNGNSNFAVSGEKK